MGFNPRFPDPFEDSVRRAQERVHGYKGIPQRGIADILFMPLIALVRATFKAVRYLVTRVWLTVARR